jgi:hypothetical protein
MAESARGAHDHGREQKREFVEGPLPYLASFAW